MLKPMVSVCAGMVLCGVCQAQPTQLKVDRGAGIARIKVQGETNRDYTLSATDLSSSNWNFLTTLTLTSPTQTWFDSASKLMPKRFYRAQKLASPTVPAYADDFRLVDHQGISRSLYYVENDPAVSAVGLIFTGNSCSTVPQ